MRRHTIIFVENLNVPVLLRLAFFHRRHQAIIVLNSITPRARRLADWLAGLSILHARPERTMFSAADVVTADGNSATIWNAVYYLPRILRQIQDDVLEKHPLLCRAGKIWPKAQLQLYIMKTLESWMTRPSLKICIVNWLIRTRFYEMHRPVTLLVPRTVFFPYLRSFAATNGIRLAGYSRPTAALSAIGKELLRIAVKLPKIPLRKPVAFACRGGQAAATAANPVQTACGRRSRIAVAGTGRPPSLDHGERSDLFWLPALKGARPDILTYFSRVDTPVSDGTLTELRAAGIECIALHEQARLTNKVPLWMPTPKKNAIQSRISRQLLAAWLTSGTFSRTDSLFLVGRFLYFAAQFAFWRDFFDANDVHVLIDNLSGSPEDVAQTVALNDLNGVKVAYQSSNMAIPIDVAVWTPVNVQFVFSQRRSNCFAPEETSLGVRVPTGYVFDNAFDFVRDRAQRWRKQLTGKGAVYILCYFDEGWSDGLYAILNHEDAMRDYEFLFRWLLSDSTLGLILKPKKASAFFARVAPLKPLLDNAVRTGRCLFLTAGNQVATTIFPSEAALASDVAIGLLAGATASLEARLAGVPSLLLAHPPLAGHPYYEWAQDSVIFETWENLKEAVERHRASPTAVPGFGDWSPVIDAIDPYRDGRAAERIALYIHWLVNRLDEGMNWRDAVQDVTRRYNERWAEEPTQETDGADRVGRA